MDIYDTNEYIVKVMKIEGCTREEALKLIEEFRRIDAQKEEIKQSMTDRDLFKAYRKNWRANKKCICCGRQDADTLSGLTRCRRCKNLQKEAYERRKRENATIRQNT